MRSPQIWGDVQPAVVRVDDNAEAKQARALDIWREAVDSIAGTPAEAYLRARCFDPAGLSVCGASGNGRRHCATANVPRSILAASAGR